MFRIRVVKMKNENFELILFMIYKTCWWSLVCNYARINTFYTSHDLWKYIHVYISKIMYILFSEKFIFFYLILFQNPKIWNLIISTNSRETKK